VESFTLEPRGPFDLAAAARFIAGWPPASSAAAAGAEVRLAFLVDDWSGHAGVVLRQDADGRVQMTIETGSAADPARVIAQAARVVSLDHDGSGYAALGERDAIVGELQRATGYLRPVLFHSPYEAAAWSVISARVQHAQAARVRDALSERYGGTLTLAGEPRVTFPAPERLLAVDSFPGLPEVKLPRLHAIARAALEGRLDREPLLAAAPEAALASLQELPGIGPFYAALILLRAVGTTDVLAAGEPRVRARAAERYGIADDADAFSALAERWRPFRTWVSVLLRAAG
jgi:DNA-3-methyladenine glycosylase II